MMRRVVRRAEGRPSATNAPARMRRAGAFAPSTTDDSAHRVESHREHRRSIDRIRTLAGRWTVRVPDVADDQPLAVPALEHGDVLPAIERLARLVRRGERVRFPGEVARDAHLLARADVVRDASLGRGGEVFPERFLDRGGAP